MQVSEAPAASVGCGQLTGETPGSGSVTVTAETATLPVLVTRKLNVIVWFGPLKLVGDADLTTVIDGEPAVGAELALQLGVQAGSDVFGGGVTVAVLFALVAPAGTLPVIV